MNPHPNRTKRIRIRSRHATPTDPRARMPALCHGPVPAEACRLLRASSVALAGVGAVGFPLADSLARWPLGGLLFADDDRLGDTSPLTHSRLSPAAGRPWKAVAAARHVARLASILNPTLDLRYTTCRLQEIPLADLKAQTAFIAAIDNLESEVQIGQRTRRLNRTLVRAAVEGQTLSVQVAVYSNTAGSPCPACGWGTEWATIGSGLRFSCDGTGGVSRANAEPTRSFPHLCALAADLACNHLLKILLHFGTSVADTMVCFSGYTNELSVVPLQRRAHCPCDHRGYRRIDLPGVLSRHSLADLLHASGLAGDAGVSLEVDGFIFVEHRVACPCGKTYAGRFLPATGALAARCPACRQAILLGSWSSSRAVSLRQLGDRVRHPLSRLGAGSARCVVIATASQGATVFGKEPLHEC